ncbi:hypothetical protein D0Z00_001723 [Geotrichum galactomycetum]|uniref:Uncharacterized protein n=1 Tax=Geotrichum galactomycetum TaxID=27317 RepID=A0ACB6V666_9ASCO|nr:hypothetical protein D0Z00_001723 [Geotrichum candidum]
MGITTLPATAVNGVAQSDNNPEQEQYEHIFDNLIEKLINPTNSDIDNDKSSTENSDPPLSLSQLAWHLHKLARKAKLLAQVQIVIYHFFSWHQPALTLSGIALWFYVCMYPMLLFNIPLIVVLFCVLIPGYDRRHPNAAIPYELRREQQRGGRAALRRPGEEDSIDEDMAGYGSSGTRLGSNQAPAVLMERLRDLQNSVAAVNTALDALQDDVLQNPRFSFNRGYELESTGLFFLFLNITVGLNLALWALNIPFNFIVLALGWSLVGFYHPAVQRYLLAKSRTAKPGSTAGSQVSNAESRDSSSNSPSLLSKIKRRLEREFYQFITKDLSTAHEAPAEHIVEIFELQRQGLTPRQWTPWVYTTGLYDLSSPLRRSGARPPGTRFLADVKPPPTSSSGGGGWFFDEDHPWQLDITPKQWVLQMGLRRHVDMDVDDAGWVYDYDAATLERGEWRRRRWTRPVFRYAVD